MSAPWVTIWPIVVGMGIRVGSPENARTFTNKAAHTSRGLRSKACAPVPATARFAGGASVLIERRAPEISGGAQRRPGAASSGRRTPRTWRKRHDAGISLSADRQATSRDVDKSARLNNDPRDPHLTETV